MSPQLNTRKIASSALAVVLWLCTIGLGLEALYSVREMFYLLFVRFGGSLLTAEHFSPVMVLILALIFLAFIIATTEYHRKWAGKPESWRLFGWSIAVELSIVILFYLL